MQINYVIIGAVCFFLGIIISLIVNFIKKASDNKNILKSSEIAKKIITDANQEANSLKKTVVLEAKEEWYKTQKEYENEINARKRELHTLEKEYNERVNNLDKRLETLERKDNHLQDLELNLKSKEAEMTEKKEE